MWCGTGLTLRLTEILEGLPVKPAGLCLLFFCIFLFFRIFFFSFQALAAAVTETEAWSIKSP